MVFTKKDFIEIEFTGRIKNGKIFDSNIKEDLEEAKVEGDPRSFIFPLGEEMFVKGIDKFLIGKDVGEYNIELQPEDAFGKKDPKKIQLMPLKTFTRHRVNPIPGTLLDFDGKIARIMTVSGGRVMVDFNNPLAGKEVEYKIKVLRKVDNQKEQIDAMNDFFFKKRLKFNIIDHRLICEVPKEIKAFSEMFKGKYKEILNLDLELKESLENETSIKK